MSSLVSLTIRSLWGVLRSEGLLANTLIFSSDLNQDYNWTTLKMLTLVASWPFPRFSRVVIRMKCPLLSETKFLCRRTLMLLFRIFRFSLFLMPAPLGEKHHQVVMLPPLLDCRDCVLWVTFILFLRHVKDCIIAVEQIYFCFIWLLNRRLEVSWRLKDKVIIFYQTIRTLQFIAATFQEDLHPSLRFCLRCMPAACYSCVSYSVVFANVLFISWKNDQ